MKRLAFFAVLTLIVFGETMAQNNDGNTNSRRNRQNRMDMTELYNQQAERLIKEIKVKKDKKDTFTALYLDYQTARFAAMNPGGSDQEKADKADLKALNDENADSLVEKRFSRQVKQLEVDREYYQKFKELLTPSQAAQVFMQSGFAGMMGGMPNFGNMRGMMGGFGGGMPDFGGMGGFGGGFGGF